MRSYVVAIVFIINIFSSLAFANGVAIQLIPGNTVIPVQQDDIRLIKEVVNVENASTVNAVFAFENTTQKEVNLQMGFPFTRDTEPTIEYKVGSVDKNFVIKIDGKESPTTKKNVTENIKLKIGSEYDFMYVWLITFRPKEKKIIECRYNVQWSDDLGLSGSFVYITKTGALWKGTIKEANFYIELDDVLYRWLNSNEYSFEISPKGYKINNKIIEWYFRNWEPRENISIRYYRLLQDEDPAVVETITGLFRFKTKYEGNIRYYTIEDLKRKKTGTEDVYDKFYVKVLRNEIFARHGKTFKSENLQRVFNNQSWYKQNPSYSDDLLNEYEKKNIEFILEYEKKKGWR